MEKMFIHQKVLEFVLTWHNWPSCPLWYLADSINENKESVRSEIRRVYGKSWNQLRKEAGWIPAYKRRNDGNNRITSDLESTRAIFKVD